MLLARIQGRARGLIHRGPGPGPGPGRIHLIIRRDLALGAGLIPGPSLIVGHRRVVRGDREGMIEGREPQCEGGITEGEIGRGVPRCHLLHHRR